MKLQHLKDQRCPVCGGRLVGESQDRQHTNGQWFEEQRFECGYDQSWAPNFSEMRVVRECPKSESAIARELARNKLDNALLKVLRSSDAPAGWVVGRMKILGFYDQAEAWLRAKERSGKNV